MYSIIKKRSSSGVSSFSFVLALSIITLHLFSGTISALYGWVITYHWVEGVISIIEFIYQVCILYFCWRYSSRPRLRPEFEEEEAYTSVLTEEVDEEEAYPSVTTEDVMEEEIDYESIY